MTICLVLPNPLRFTPTLLSILHGLHYLHGLLGLHDLRGLHDLHDLCSLHVFYINICCILISNYLFIYLFIFLSTFILFYLLVYLEKKKILEEKQKIYLFIYLFLWEMKSTGDINGRIDWLEASQHTPCQTSSLCTCMQPCHAWFPLMHHFKCIGPTSLQSSKAHQKLLNCKGNPIGGRCCMENWKSNEKCRIKIKAIGTWKRFK